MKTRRFSKILAVVSLLLLCISCGDTSFDNTKPGSGGALTQLLIGTWETTSTGDDGIIETVIVTFKKDGTIISSDGNGNYYANYYIMTRKEMLKKYGWNDDEDEPDGNYFILEFLDDDGSVIDIDGHLIKELTSSKFVFWDGESKQDIVLRKIK